VVEILLERERCPMLKEEKYGNALQAASRGGHEEVVEILLEHERISTLKEDDMVMHYKQQYTVTTGVAQMLLEHGADFNARGRYSNAGQAAAAMMERSVSRLRLRHP